ncbi:MAG: colicin E5-related ribonuclease [Alphaproteobacteria bacterium]
MYYNYDVFLKRREELARIHRLALHEYMFGRAEEKFRVDQPRVPRGNPRGGEWTRINAPGGESLKPGSDPARPGVEDIDDPPLEPVYPEAMLLALLPAAALWRAWQLWASYAARRAAMGWRLGAFKSPTKWGNQLRTRGWTPEQITEVIAKGKKFPAPNFVNKGNQAIRYQDRSTGRFVVRDEVTKEILQISRSGFKPLNLE